MTDKPKAGQPLPEISLPTVGGGTASLGAATGGWRAILVYRGKHCPLCKRYLGGLQDLARDYAEAEIELLLVSADPKEKAETVKEDWGLAQSVAYDLKPEQMRELGLYISEPRSEQETDRPFAEPGLFVVNPQGKLQIVDISNAPFARPDLTSLLNGIKFVQDKDYPVRGTAA
ncbi:MAG: peroxiredoxin-like family protein [Rhodovibrionaceae bacterium]